MNIRLYFDQYHCVKSVPIRSYSGPYFPAFGLNTYSVQMRENADQNNSKYGHFLRSACENLINHWITLYYTIANATQSITYNGGQNSWGKVEKSSKIRGGLKTTILAFA